MLASTSLRIRLRWLGVLAAGLLMVAGCSGDNPGPGTSNPDNPNHPGNPDNRTKPTQPPQATYVRGATDFVSADAQAGQQSDTNRDNTEAPAAGDAGGGTPSDRTVEEGDIYRVLGGDLILNLNSYRGLQIVDFSNVDDPRIIGRLRVSGYPVEMYVVGDRAFLLLNNWVGYYGSRDDVSVGMVEGGLVMSVDLSDPTAPVAIDEAHVPGYIQTSRLTRGSDGAALYVATGGYDQWQNEDGTWQWDTRTVVQSYDVSDGTLAAKTQINLGGYVTAIQATTEALLVARTDWSYSDGRSQVAVVDITDPHGAMVMGDDVTVDGSIADQFNMDLYNGVLRVFSGSLWGNEYTNYLQTFDASNLSALTPIDRATFGDGTNLYATLFVGNKAFGVTYRQVDPLHAFEVTDSGEIHEMSEFVVSGWNDFFRAVYDGDRMIGIGVNDTAGRTLAVSLYDISDLTNPSPLVARAEVDADYSWSEANWDHRAFSVLENAVVAEGPHGESETGLVLLPFSGYNSDWSSYTAAVQIFTFSENSLTRRGVMIHGTPVRRSFEAADDLTANLSDLKLSLFDTSDPDAPAELGSVELAPNYTDVMRFGDYTVRVDNGSNYYSWWWGTGTDLPDATVEVLPAGVDPDLGQAVASIDIPADAQVYRSGHLLVAVTMRAIDTSAWPYTYETHLSVYDMTDPTHPRTAGTLTTDRLQPSYYYYNYYPGGPMVDGGTPAVGGACANCSSVMPWYGGYYNDVQPVPNGLAFLQRHDESELLGTQQVCSTYPVQTDYCWDSTGPVADCSYYTGGISCYSLEGADPYCTGSIQQCTYGEDGSWSCVDVDPGTVTTTQNCYSYDLYRYWQHFTLESLDLTNPDAPTLADTTDIGRENEGVSMLADGSNVWVTYRRPVDVGGDSRPYVRYYVQEADLSDPGHPALGDAINVPGELLAVDGNTIFTRDLLWGAEIVETAIARLTIADGRAHLQASRRFENETVQGIALDGDGHVLVSHQMAWSIAYQQGVTDNLAHLDVLNANDGSLSVLSDVPVDSWASLRDGRAGRALFQVPGGLLVFNLDDPTAPYPQAYFATTGWPSDILVDGRDILFAAGVYGIYQFGLDTFNLLDHAL